MAYYLTVSKKKGEYTPLNIRKSKFFVQSSNYTNETLSLQEIDNFTTSFVDEAELKMDLVNEGILNYKDIDRPLTARILRNGTYNKVAYDFLYQKDFKYLADPNEIIRKVYELFMSEDFRFIKQFATRFINYYDCKTTASEIVVYINESIRQNRYVPHMLYKDEAGDFPIIRMTKLLIYNYNELSNGKTVYQRKVKHRNLHTIIAFINNYESKYQEEVKENKNIKRKIKKKEPDILEQTSLFEDE